MKITYGDLLKEARAMLGLPPCDELQDAAPQASDGSPQGSGVGQRQTAPKGEVAESDNAPAADAAPDESDWGPYERQ